jgi:hypothetical protein
MKNMRTVTTILIIIGLGVILFLLIPVFFPKLPVFRQSVPEATPDISSESVLCIKNLDFNRSYSIQISLRNSSRMILHQEIFILKAGDFFHSPLLQSERNGNYSVHLIVDGNTTFEYPVMIPSDYQFEVKPGGYVEKGYWVFLE